MHNIAFIPVRGGSKSIPLKNIKDMCGKPLVYWTVLAASECEAVDEVVVSTDSEQIRETVLSFQLPKVTVVGRSEEVSTDTASTESVMLEYAKDHTFDNIALVQATSPLLTAKDLQNGFDELAKEGVDSVISCVEQKRFQQNRKENGEAYPMNYDVFKRPRRQEFDAYYTENGAFYMISRALLLKTGNRLAGSMRIVEMPQASFLEIDEPEDWEIISLLKKRQLEQM